MDSKTENGQNTASSGNTDLGRMAVTADEAANIFAQLPMELKNGQVFYEPKPGRDDGDLVFWRAAEKAVRAADPKKTPPAMQIVGKKEIVAGLIEQKKAHAFNEALAADPDAKLEWDSFHSFNIKDGPISQLLKKISLKL